MTGGALALSPAAALARARGTVPALISGLMLLGLLFHGEIAAAVHVWATSTAYNHCFLVIPIAAYIAWDRRALLAGAAPRPAPLLALAAIPLAFAWLAAERVGIMEARQLAAMGFVQLLFMAVLGPALWRLLSAPLLYLFFLVPFGAFSVPVLQHVTARFAATGLDLLGIPNFSDGFTIEIPEGTFFVAEACAGLRFLIASVAFGALYACLMYRSPARRAAFMAASVVVPVVANGLRALGIVVLGHILGSAEAAAADHILYGWIFFSIVILLLILAGLPFRQEPHFLAPSVRRPPVGGSSAGAATAAWLLLALAAAGPLAAGSLDREAAAVPAPALAAPGLCAAFAAPGPPGVQAFSCDGGRLRLDVAVFPPRASLSRILAEQRRLSGEELDADADSFVLRAHAIAWRLTLAESTPDAAAVALWIDGAQAGGGLATRLAQARNSLFGARYRPVLAVLRPVVQAAETGTGARQQAEARIRAFLDGEPELGAALAALAHRRAADGR